MEKQDKRYIKTHEKIVKVFKEIILEKEYREITVSEISRRADINRKTFYRHYDSMYGVLEELQQEIIGDLSELQSFCSLPLSFEQYRNIVEGFIRILNKNRELHKRLFCSGDYRFVFDRIRATMTKRMDTSISLQKVFGEKQNQLFIDFFSYGFLFVVGDWLASENPLPEKEFIENTARIMYYSAKGISENKPLPSIES